MQHLLTKADHVVLKVSPEDVTRFQAFLEAHRLSSMQALFALVLCEEGDRTGKLRQLPHWKLGAAFALA